MSMFEELVESKIADPFGKLARLIKYTQGEAKELIQHCSQMSQPDGFLMAKDLLDKEYGDPHKVTSAYMKELKSWKTLKTGDVKEFKKFPKLACGKAGRMWCRRFKSKYQWKERKMSAPCNSAA